MKYCILLPFTLLLLHVLYSQDDNDSGLDDIWDFSVDSPSDKTGTIKRGSTSSTDSSPSSSEVRYIPTHLHILYM